MTRATNARRTACMAPKEVELCVQHAVYDAHLFAPLMLYA